MSLFDLLTKLFELASESKRRDIARWEAGAPAQLARIRERQRAFMRAAEGMPFRLRSPQFLDLRLQDAALVELAGKEFGALFLMARSLRLRFHFVGSLDARTLARDPRPQTAQALGHTRLPLPCGARQIAGLDARELCPLRAVQRLNALASRNAPSRSALMKPRGSWRRT